MSHQKSEQLFEKSKRVIPGGVNSPVRAFKSVGGDPLFVQKAAGSKIVDVDGNEYIDFVASWGPMIFGHAHPQIVEAVKRTAESGTSFGAPTELELEMAERVVSMVPGIDVVRMVNSGTEAVMSALRLARAITGRKVIVKFEGCYHGHGDSMLVTAGSGVLSLGIPDSPGVPAELAELTHTLSYNNLEEVRNYFAEKGDAVAAVIVEPVAGNMGVIPPVDGFLQTLREETQKQNALLIFDEVITGFRVAPGGAQERFGITPDITCLGKIIGGGLPVGAYGGTREVMDHVAPQGTMYQAGTLSGNPLAMAAGVEMLKLLSQDGVHDQLEEKASRLCEGYRKNTERLGIPTQFTRVGSMFSMFFTGEPIVDFKSVKTSDTERFGKFFKALLEEGVYIAPSQFEAGFMSAVHTDEDIEKSVRAHETALKKAIG